MELFKNIGPVATDLWNSAYGLLGTGGVLAVISGLLIFRGIGKIVSKLIIVIAAICVILSFMDVSFADCVNLIRFYASYYF